MSFIARSESLTSWFTLLFLTPSRNLLMYSTLVSRASYCAAEASAESILLWYLSMLDATRSSVLTPLSSVTMLAYILMVPMGSRDRRPPVQPAARAAVAAEITIEAVVSWNCFL